MKISFRHVALFSLLGALMVSFQNCAKSGTAQFEDSLIADTYNFFEYRYEKASPIYFEVQVIPVEADASVKTYEVIGFAANSDGSLESIDYSLELFAPDERSICAVRTGVLSEGVTSVKEVCIMQKDLQIGYAVMKVRSQGGEWHVYNKKYSN